MEEIEHYMRRVQWKSVDTIQRMLRSSIPITLIVIQILQQLEELSDNNLLRLFRFGVDRITITNRNLEIILEKLSAADFKVLQTYLESLEEALGFEIHLDAEEINGNPHDLQYCLVISEPPIDPVLDGGGDSDKRVEIAIPTQVNSVEVLKAMVNHS